MVEIMRINYKKLIRDRINSIIISYALVYKQFKSCACRVISAIVVNFLADTAILLFFMFDLRTCPICIVGMYLEELLYIYACEVPISY